jgi:hypothetical protein
VRRKQKSTETERLATEIGALASSILPRYVTMPARYRDAYDEFNAIVRADGSGMRLSASTEDGGAFWCSPGVDDFWLQRFAVSGLSEGDEPELAERPEEPKVQDWLGWEVLYVEWLIRHRMVPGSQRAITEHTARVARGEASFLCVVKFAGVWYLEAGRRDDDDILTRAATEGLDAFAFARGEA